MSICQLCSRSLQPFLEDTFCTWCVVQTAEESALSKIQRVLSTCSPVSAELAQQFHSAWDALWESHVRTDMTTLNARVATEKNVWQSWREQWRQYEIAMRNLPPEAEFILLLSKVISIRTESRSFLQEHAGLEVEVQTYTAHVQAFAAMTGVIHQANLAIISTETECPRDVFGAAVAAMRQALPQVLLLALATGMSSPSRSQQEAATLTIAGWASTEVRLHESHREALGRDGDKFLERLAEDVWAAWHTTPQKSLSALLNQSRRLFDELRTNRYKSQELKRDVEDPLRNPANQIEVEDLIAKESLYQAKIFERAGLTQDEEASLRLKLLEYSDQQIANVRNKSLNAVKQDLLRARKKLKQVLSE